MSKTPEGTIKKLIKDCLEKHEIYPAKKAGAFPVTANGWYFMPVQSMGVKGIPDFIGVIKSPCMCQSLLSYHAIFFAIEAKAPGKKPTGFQQLQMEAIRDGGGNVFVVDGKGSLEVFEEWLVKNQV